MSTNKAEKNPQRGDTIAVWFSCGAASAVALKETIERYPECKVRALNNFILDEDADNRRFLRDVEAWLNIEIEDVRNPAFPNCSAEEVWNFKRFMSGVGGAPCTYELKFRARILWERQNVCDWMVLGFTAGEESRYEDFSAKTPNILPVLIDAGITKGDCFNMISAAGIELPATYKKGYPNANCVGCVKATSPTYWNHVRVVDPEIFERRAKQSREIGAKLVRVKGERVFLDELDPNAKGRPMKDMDFECGIMCAKD